MTLKTLPNTAGRVGRWIFSTAVGLRVPYFATIRATVVELEPGRCVVQVPKRRRILNHHGTVHAIASRNAAELAAGLATEAATPASHRWIAQGMTVRYVAMPRTGPRATATIADMPEPGTDPAQVVVSVDIVDGRHTLVVHADITMHINAKKQRRTSSDNTAPAT